MKILQEVAANYRRQFDRPLPVSSLVRPEQYQQTLRRYNRAATTIETPPHSTGLAFDIDYRYMSVAEQNFVMAELAGLKAAGRIPRACKSPAPAALTTSMISTASATTVPAPAARRSDCASKIKLASMLRFSTPILLI